MTAQEQFKYAVERARYEAEVLRQLRGKFELARPEKSENQGGSACETTQH